MSRKKNLIIQLNEKLNSKLKIGTSRHEAKQVYKATHDSKSEGYNNLKSDYVHSIKTADNYREVINAFGRWLKNNEPSIWHSKDLSTVTKEVAYKYMQEREQEGKSPSTISKDLAGLNKVLELNLNKKEGCLAKRSYKDITRSRHHTNEKISDKLKLKNHDQIILSKSTGIRRESMLKIKPEDFKEKNGRLVLNVIEKGGRERYIHVLKAYEKEVREIIDRSTTQALFTYYSRKFDNHSFRADYAEERYAEIIAERKSKGLSTSVDYRQKYNSLALKELTKDLGHNRINVCVENYLGK